MHAGIQAQPLPELQGRGMLDFKSYIQLQCLTTHEIIVPDVDDKAAVRVRSQQACC